MLETIWQQFHQQLLAFINSRVDDRSAAEDILQNVFVKVHKNLAQLKADDKLQAWLYQICRHAIIDYYRSNRIEPALVNVDEIPAEPQHEDDQKQLSDCVRVLIMQLPDNMRDILMASEIAQDKQQAIADEFGLSLPALKSRIKRGRKLLQKKLQACCDFEFGEQGVDAYCRNRCGCAE